MGQGVQEECLWGGTWILSLLIMGFLLWLYELSLKYGVFREEVMI